jgi:type I restriction enzyme S subunit
MKAGWQTKNLGDVCNVVGGGTPSKDKAAFYSGDIPWATVRDLKQEVITSTEFKITKDAVKSSATNIIPSGNVVIATRVGLGKVCLLGQDTAINQDLRGIIPLNVKTLDVRFLFWWLKSIADLIVAEGTGATVQGVKLPFVKSLQVPLPPLPEQQRIVGILDEAFDGIATAKANAEKNLQNARALFESHLQSVFTQRGKMWVKKQLADICEIFADGDWIESKDQSPEGIRLIQTGNVGVGIFKDRGEKARYISEATFKRLRCTEIFEEDCLISRLPDPAGRSCMLPDTGERMITAVDCTIVRFDLKQVLPTFFVYYSQSSDYLKALDAETTGTTRKRISRSKLGQALIPVAPLADQRRIVDELDELAIETQRLASLYQRKLAALDDLKNSLLHQAFSGAL